MSIKFIRLNNGDDIIGEIISNNKTHIEIQNTMSVMVDMSIEEGCQTVIIFPWLPKGVVKENMSKAKVKLSDIVIITEVEDKIVTHYQELCNSYTPDAELPIIRDSKGKDISNVLNFAKKPIANIN